MEQEIKRCPNCGEEILAIAKKCKHCGEWLDKKEQKPCPICGEQIDVETIVCPHCNEPTHFNSTAANSVVQHHEDNNSRFANVKSVNAPQKKSKSKQIIKFVIYCIIGLTIGVCIAGIKQCIKDYKHKESLSRPNPFADALKKKRDNAFNLLTQSPWQGNLSNSTSEIEDGWLVTANISMDSKLNYMNDDNYTENGTIIVNIAYSTAELMWRAEGKIQYYEEGVFHLYSETSMSEKPKNTSSEVISANVTYNNTSIPDEDIRMDVLRRLYNMNNELQKTEDQTMYEIKNLSKTSLVLGIMKEKDVIKSSGPTLTYKR